MRSFKTAPLFARLGASRIKNGQVYTRDFITQVTDFFERRAVSHECTGKCFGTFEQIALVHDCINHPDFLRLIGRHWYATGDGLKRSFRTNQTWQTLCATAAGQQPQGNFRQTDTSRRNSHPIVATQCSLKTPPQRRAMDGGNRRFLEVFDDFHSAKETRRLERLAKFSNIRPSNESPTITNENRGDSVIGIGFDEAFQQTLAHMVAQCVHWRVIDRDNADIAIFCVGD